MTRARLRTPAPVRVVFDGQSHNLSPAAPDNMPTFLMRGRGIPWANVSVGGQGWEELAPTAAVRLHRQARPAGLDVLVMNGGQGDFLDLGRTGAQCYAAAESYRDAALAAGFDRVLITTMPPLGAGFYPGRPTEADLQALADHNALLLANADDWDAVVDLHVPPLDDPYDGTYYLFDRVHWTPTGAQAAADLIAPALAGLLTP